jgi:hypothetical protein
VKGRVRLCRVKHDGSASATEWIERARGQRDEERIEEGFLSPLQADRDIEWSY